MSKYLDKVQQAFVKLKGKERDTFMHRVISMALYEHDFDSISYLIDTEYQNFITSCILRRHLGSLKEVEMYVPYIRAHPKAGEAAIECAKYGYVDGIKQLYDNSVNLKSHKSDIVKAFRGSRKDLAAAKLIMNLPPVKRVVKSHP